MALYVRELKHAEEQQLRQWLDGDDPDLRHRARVILLSSEGYRVPEIGPMVNAHPTNLRKWIHRFNQRGLRGLISARSGGPPPRFTTAQRGQIVELALSSPRDLGLSFSRWTLHKLAEQCVKRGIVDSISHEYVRQILLAADADYRHPTRRNGHAGGRSTLGAGSRAIRSEPIRTPRAAAAERVREARFSTGTD
ncbi:MAG: helix-turn-helix domain-containing protein [Ardenticatenaceae bacterium]|nr:helix-turn-helix domain-containing protein [Ardenticatenaceae bacterium]